MDLIVILLTAITIALALLGFFIAALSFVGWKEARNAMIAASKLEASRTAEAAVNQYMASDEFAVLLKKTVQAQAELAVRSALMVSAFSKEETANIPEVSDKME